MYAVKLKALLPLLIIAVSGLAAWGMYVTRGEVKKEAVSVPDILVEVATANRRPVQFTVKSRGTVTPRTRTTLVAEASGQIVEVSDAFVSGGFFSKGDVLIRIDPRNYESIVKRASAAVARAETQLATESALAGYAREDYQRLRGLNPALSDEASDLAMRKPQLQEAMAQLQSAEADLDKAMGDLERTVIRAPYEGLIREKLADVGQFVNVGSQLAVTFAVDVAEIRLPVTQQDLQFLNLDKLRRNEPINTVISAQLGGSTYSWAAEVVRSEGVFDASSRVLYLVATVQNPYRLGASGEALVLSQESDDMPLLIGTFVTAEISGRFGGNLFPIPRHSLKRGKVLWLIDEGSKIQPQEVNVVASDDRFFYIDGGLEEGTQYCSTPIEKPLPGMRVRISG